jgi:hypothetical protein
VIPLVLGDGFGSPDNPVINALFVLSFGALPAFMGGASTGPGTTPRRWWPRSPDGCGTPSTSTPSATTWWAWSSGPSSPRRCPCGWR